jgi:hypothetical protein
VLVLQIVWGETEMPKLRKLAYVVALGALGLHLSHAASCPTATLQFYLLNFGPGNSCTLAGGALIFGDFTTGTTGILSSGTTINPWSNTNSNQPPTPPFPEYASVLATPFTEVVGGFTAVGLQYTQADGLPVSVSPGGHSDLNIDFDTTGSGASPVMKGVFTEMTGSVGLPYGDDKFVEEYLTGGGTFVNILTIDPFTATTVNAINLFSLPTNALVHTDTNVDVRGNDCNPNSPSQCQGFASLINARQGIFTNIPPPPVPEPSTLFVAGGILALVLAKARRRRSA